MDNTTREKAREYAEKEARRKAVEKGADEQTLEVIDVMEVPLAYLPGNAVRYYLRVVGDLADSASQILEEFSIQGNYKRNSCFFTTSLIRSCSIMLKGCVFPLRPVKRFTFEQRCFSKS